MGAGVGVLNRLRGVPVVPIDDGSVVSLTSSQESLLREINGGGSSYKDDHKEEFEYPPMPSMGSNFDIQILVRRNAKMYRQFQDTMNVVSRDVTNAATEGKTVPVADATSRVLVSEEISERMHQVRTRKQIRLAQEANINEIQQALAVRMRMHEIMNANSSRVLVNKLEPVFIREARGEVEYVDCDDDVSMLGDF